MQLFVRDEVFLAPKLNPLNFPLCIVELIFKQYVDFHSLMLFYIQRKLLSVVNNYQYFATLKIISVIK